MERKKNGLYSLLAYLVVFELLGLVIQLIAVQIFTKLGIPNSLFSPLMNFIIYICLLVPLIYINRHDLVSDFNDFKNTKRVLLSLILCILICYGFNYAFSIVSSSVEKQMNSFLFILGPDHLVTSNSNNQAEIVKMLNGSYWPLMFIPAAILGPICEELIFRKAIFDLCGENKKELAFVISTVSFVFIHLVSSIGKYDFLSICLMFISYLGASLGFGFIYMKKGNIFYTIIAHMFMNIISMILIMFLL